MAQRISVEEAEFVAVFDVIISSSLTKTISGSSGVSKTCTKVVLT